jgi:glycosylphosphatidylinositol transamidase (GPIT) subunit GPI8
MKIRNGFVSNSSSSSFLIAVSTESKSDIINTTEIFFLHYGKNCSAISTKEYLYIHKNNIKEYKLAIPVLNSEIKQLEDLKNNDEAIKIASVIGTSKKRMRSIKDPRYIKDFFNAEEIRSAIEEELNPVKIREDLQRSINDSKNLILSIEKEIKEKNEIINMIKKLESTKYTIVSVTLDNMESQTLLTRLSDIGAIKILKEVRT